MSGWTIAGGTIRWTTGWMSEQVASGANEMVAKGGTTLSVTAIETAIPAPSDSTADHHETLIARDRTGMTDWIERGRAEGRSGTIAGIGRMVVATTGIRGERGERSETATRIEDDPRGCRKFQDSCYACYPVASCLAQSLCLL